MPANARMFEPPYYAVIFTTRMSDDTAGYNETAARMEELAAQQPGFLGFDSAREKIGVTVSYWRDRESIQRWREQSEHLAAQKNGRERWYDHYQLHIARVEHFHEFNRSGQNEKA